MSENKKLLSIVTPAYNEAENLGEFYSRVINATNNLNLEIEIIYINDGSQDSTIDIITKQRQIDNRITIIDLSRNFGKEIALTAGLDYSSGDAVIVIDADLQDPPELIPKLVEKWREGYDVVNAKRIKAFLTTQWPSSSLPAPAAPPGRRSRWDRQKVWARTL